MKDEAMDVGGCCGIGRSPVLDPLVSAFSAGKFDDVGAESDVDGLYST